MFPRTTAFPRGLTLGHQLIEGRFGLGEQSRMLRVARRERAFLFRSEQVLGASMTHLRWGI
jgi:hypothetical protein